MLFQSSFLQIIVMDDSFCKFSAFGATFFLQILQDVVKIFPAAKCKCEYALAGVGGALGLFFFKNSFCPPP